jgi:Ankyrin repeats (3 copies)
MRNFLKLQATENSTIPAIGGPNSSSARGSYAPTTDPRSVFLRAVREGDLPAVHRLALEHRWLLDTDLGTSPILLAIRYRRRAIANVLAHLGAKLNILEASALGHEKRVLEWLSFHSATVHQRDAHGWTALHHASEHGHTTIVKALLEAGADANAVIANTTTRAIDLATNPKIQTKLKNHAARGLNARIGTGTRTILTDPAVAA